MEKMTCLITTVFAAMAFMASNLAISAEQAASPPPAKKSEKSKKDSKEKVFPWDNGPSAIDVSKYPKEQQDNYKVFEKKCQKCHTLARPINAPYSADELAAYVKKMMKKPRAGVDVKSAGKITEFLKYDSKVRKENTGEKGMEKKGP